MREETIRRGLLCVPYVTQDIEADAEQMTIRHVISSGIRSHTGLEIDQSGWSFEFYHGVVLWDHDASAPAIGKNMDLALKGDPAKLHAVTKFAPTDLGRELFTLYEGGYMRDWSVGISIDESELVREKDEVVALRSIRQHLMEYSATPIGANHEAVTQALDKGLIRPETAGMLGVAAARAGRTSQAGLSDDGDLPGSLAPVLKLLDETGERLTVLRLGLALGARK